MEAEEPAQATAEQESAQATVGQEPLKAKRKRIRKKKDKTADTPEGKDGAAAAGVASDRGNRGRDGRDESKGGKGKAAPPGAAAPTTAKTNPPPPSQQQLKAKAVKERAQALRSALGYSDAPKPASKWVCIEVKWRQEKGSTVRELTKRGRRLLEACHISPSKVKLISPNGRSILELYVVEQCATEVLELLHQSKVAANKRRSETRMHNPTPSGRNIEQAMVTRLSFLWKLARLPKLRECIVEGLPSSLVAAIRTRAGEPVDSTESTEHAADKAPELPTQLPTSDEWGAIPTSQRGMGPAPAGFEVNDWASIEHDETTSKW